MRRGNANDGCAGVFVTLPLLSAPSFICAAVCRAQQRRAFKIASRVLRTVGVIIVLPTLAAIGVAVVACLS